MEKKFFFISLLVVLMAVSFSCCTGTASVTADSGLKLVTEEFYPFNYLDENGRITGQSTEVVTGILELMNQKTEIEMMPWSDGYNLVISEPDAAIYSTTRTEERENLFKWVGPIGSYEFMLYSKNGSGIDINSLDAAKKAGSIAVVKDDARQQFLKDNGFTNLVLCGEDGECLDLLMGGEADLWLGSTANAERIAVDEGFNPISLDSVYPVRTVDVYIAFNPAVNDEVIAGWQNALDSIKKDGTFDQICIKYGTLSSESLAAPVSANEANMALLAVMAYADGKITNIQRSFEVLALTEEAGSDEWAQIKPLLQVLEEKEPDARIWYAHPNGTYYTVVDDLASANLMDRSYFPVVLSGKESVGTVVVSHSTGKNAAIVAVPVMDGNTATGVLGASIYMDTLSDTLRNELPSGMVFYALDEDGKFALNSDKGLISEDISIHDGNTSFGQALKQMMSEYYGNVEYEYGGRSWYAIFRTSPLTGWRIAVAYAI